MYLKHPDGTSSTTVNLTGTSGWIYVADIEPQGTGLVSNKVYQDSGSTILQSAISSTQNVRIHLRASYPLVDVDGTGGTLTRDVDQSHYSGYVDVTVANTKTITVTVKNGDGLDGAIDTVYLQLQLPTEITALSFTGSYPIGQTELKEGDTFQITGTTIDTIDAVEVYDYEACSYALITIAPTTNFTISAPIADRGNTAVLRPARVRVRFLDTGDYSPTRDTDYAGGSVDGVDVVNCNNLHPSVFLGTKTYPGGQSALKNSETATVQVFTGNLDTILYDSPNLQLSITNPTIDEVLKTVQRIAGTYNDSINNLRITANRAANNATTIVQTVMDIAHVPLQISVIEPESRLRTGAAPGAAYSITISLDQTVDTAPSLDADSPNAGVFQGSWTNVGGMPSNIWTRDLRVADTDTPGVYNWKNPYAINRAGLITNTITGNDEYEIGGFTKRTVTFSPWSQQENLPVVVTDYSKLQAGIFTATNQQSIKNPVQGNQDDLDDTYTVLNIGSSPTVVFWNDLDAANSNSSGTAQLIDIEEVV